MLITFCFIIKDKLEAIKTKIFVQWKTQFVYIDRIKFVTMLPSFPFTCFFFSHFSLNDKRVFVKEQAWEEYLIPYLVYSSLTFQFVIRLMFSLKLNISLHVPLLLVATCEIMVLDFCKLKPFIHEMKPCFMQIYVCYKIDIALYDRILMRLEYMKSCNTNIYQNLF